MKALPAYHYNYYYYYYYYYYKGYLYSARLLNAANALQSQLHVKQKCIQFASEHVLPNVWCSEFSRKTVPRTVRVRIRFSVWSVSVYAHVRYSNNVLRVALTLKTQSRSIHRELSWPEAKTRVSAAGVDGRENTRARHPHPHCPVSSTHPLARHYTRIFRSDISPSRNSFLDVRFELVARLRQRDQPAGAGGTHFWEKNHMLQSVGNGCKLATASTKVTGRLLANITFAISIYFVQNKVAQSVNWKMNRITRRITCSNSCRLSMDNNTYKQHKCI